MSSENNIPNDVSFDDDSFEDNDLDRIPSWVDDENVEDDLSASDDSSLSASRPSGRNEPEVSSLAADVRDEPSDADISPALLDSLKETEEQRDMYIEALRQLQADFENYKKRIQRDIDEEAENRSVRLIEDLLPVIDNFELALQNIGKDPQTKKIRKGIELVYNDLVAVLDKQGLEVISAQGEVFDPEVHEAVSHEDNGEHEEEVVVEVLRSGYKVRGRVVRPAMVKVAK